MQLVELQRNVHAPEGDEVAVVAISYDPVETLADFAAKHDIGYPLLGDVGSEVITRIGLLNDRIMTELAYWGRTPAERHKGLPYPGTFILDEDGVITDRIFESSHRLRPGGSLLLRRMGIEAGNGGPMAVAEGPALAAAAWADSVEYFPNQLNHLTLRIGVEPGYHVYVPPNPAGFIDLEVTIDAPEGVFVHDFSLPTGHPFSVEGFDEEFTVAEDEFDIHIPFYVLEDSGDVTLQVRIAYQACDAATCLVPDHVDLAVALTEIRA
jgi:hypothetical protein